MRKATKAERMAFAWVDYFDPMGIKDDVARFGLEGAVELSWSHARRDRRFSGITKDALRTAIRSVVALRANPRGGLKAPPLSPGIVFVGPQKKEGCLAVLEITMGPYQSNEYSVVMWDRSNGYWYVLGNDGGEGGGNELGVAILMAQMHGRGVKTTPSYEAAKKAARTGKVVHYRWWK